MKDFTAKQSIWDSRGGKTRKTQAETLNKWMSLWLCYQVNESVTLLSNEWVCDCYQMNESVTLLSSRSVFIRTSRQTKLSTTRNLLPDLPVLVLSKSPPTVDSRRQMAMMEQKWKTLRRKLWCVLWDQLVQDLVSALLVVWEPHHSEEMTRLAISYLYI